MTTIKQRRITKIVREFAKAQDSYDITGVDLSLSKFFYRASQELFQDLATGDYRIDTSSGRQTLIITNQEILSNVEAFQVGYVLDFTATKYETQWNVDINTLKDKYNQLVDSTQELWEYIRKTGFISDDTTIDLILPQLDDEQLWYRVDGQYKALSLQDFRDLGERLIEAYVEYQKELFELMFRNARENIINTKDNSIKELQGILDALNINVDNFTGTKKAELQKMIDDFKAGLETIEVGNAHSLGGHTADKYQRKEDSELQTSSKIVVGAINELNDDIFDLNEAIDDIVLSKTSSEDTISDLMASRKYSIGDVVEVLGYYSKGDGAGHTRQKKPVGYDGADAVIGADGSIWGIVHSGEVSVSWFGAKGDGITDDIDKIQKAINIGNIIKFDKKTYCVGNNIFIKPEVSIIGDSTIIKCIGSTMNGVFNIEEPVYINNLNIDGFIINVDKKCMHGIYIHSNKGGSNISFKNISVINPSWDGICIHGSYIYQNEYYEPWKYENFFNVKFYNVRSLNELINEKTRGGIFVEHCVDVEINKCYAKGFCSGLHIEGVANANILNSIFEDNNSPNRENNVYHADVLIGRNHNINFTNCTFKRENKSQTVVDPDKGSFTYRNLSILSRFQKNVVFNSCNFIGGGSYLTETGNDELNCHEGIKFIGCKFYDGLINFYVPTTQNPIIKDINLIGCNFYNYSLSFVDVKKLIISNSQLYLRSKNVSVEGSSKDVLISNCSFNGGIVSGAPLEARNSTIFLSTTENVKIQGCTFSGYSDYNTKYILGCYNNNKTSFDNNTVFLVNSNNVIKEEYNFWNTTLSAKGNIINYQDSAFKSWGGMIDANLKISVNNIINGALEISITKLDTSYYALKMQQEGVYEDFIIYMDSKTEYDRLQKESERQRQLLFEQRENQEQTYEEWLSGQPQLMPFVEPQPSQALLDFKEKYLG